MSLKYGLLGLLNHEPMTGYDLDKEFKTSLAHFWQAKTSQVYRELDTMEQTGWLKSEQVVQTEKPNKRVYSITAKGREAFLDWLSNPNDIEGATRIKSVFFMRLFFAGETSRKQALELVYAYRAQCLVGMQEMDMANTLMTQAEPSHSAEDAMYWRLIMMNGEMMRKTRLEWAEKAIEILEGRNQQ